MLKGLAACLLLAMTLVLVHAPLEAGEPLDVAKMKVALKTSTPEESGFLQHVSNLVEDDVLPRDLVISTFLWAKKQPGRPFQYFKRGLKVRAAKRGIKL